MIGAVVRHTHSMRTTYLYVTALLVACAGAEDGVDGSSPYAFQAAGGAGEMPGASGAGPQGAGGAGPLQGGSGGAASGGMTSGSGGSGAAGSSSTGGGDSDPDAGRAATGGSGGSTGDGGPSGAGGSDGAGGAACVFPFPCGAGGVPAGGAPGVAGAAGMGGLFENFSPSPDNIPECPAEAPENPWGPCVGVPVYATCNYTDGTRTYGCICDWIHWICI